MAIPDKIAAAKRINEFLRGVVANAGLRLKYRISVDPPMAEDRDWEKPEILVELSGPDSPLLLERGGLDPIPAAAASSTDGAVPRSGKLVSRTRSGNDA